MLPHHRIIETVTRVAPLGVRFYDRVTKQIISGLTVTASGASNPSRKLALFPNSAGVYILQNVPGLRDFEQGTGDADFWSRVPAALPYTVAVSDAGGQFLPFSFKVDLPVKRLFVWNCEPLASPEEPSSGDVPLFSTPRRPIPTGYTVVRADLYDPIADRPGAWAVVDVRYAGRLLGRGVADARGCLSVPLTYPPPVDFEPLSPMVTGAPLTEQTWQVELQVWYVSNEATAVPDLCMVLNQLNAPQAHAWASWDGLSATHELTEATLAYGRELILRTNAGGSPLPRLYIVPAGSPP